MPSPQVLQQTRQQSEQVMEATKEAIGKKIREAQNEFREHVTKELQQVGQHAQRCKTVLRLKTQLLNHWTGLTKLMQLLRAQVAKTHIDLSEQ